MHSRQMEASRGEDIKKRDAATCSVAEPPERTGSRAKEKVQAEERQEQMGEGSREDKS